MWTPQFSFIKETYSVAQGLIILSCLKWVTARVFLSPCIWSLLKPVIGHYTSGRHRSGRRPVSRHLINHAVSLPSILCSGAACREQVQPVCKENGSRKLPSGHLEQNGHYKNTPHHSLMYLQQGLWLASMLVCLICRNLTGLIYMENDLWGLCCPENTDGVLCTHLPLGNHNDC